MTFPTLEACLPRDGARDQAVADTILRIAGAAVRVADLLARGPLEGALGASVEGAHDAGDDQKHLDVVADRLFHEALAQAPVAHLASEERGDIETLAPGAPLAVAIDPLDGSSNIDIDAPVGAIFSVLEAASTPEASFLRPGTDQLAAGYVVFGPMTALMLTTGRGVDLFVLDRAEGAFRRARAGVRVPVEAREFAINASNRRHWTRGLQDWFDACLAGRDGPLGADHNTRWIASLVAEAFRIFTRGGIYLYPADARRGYEAGRLRLLYEAAPIAFLTEQAGGRASDGLARILDRVPARLHERTPFVFGSAAMVEAVERYGAR